MAASASILPWSVVNPNLADPDRGDLLPLADIYTDLDTTDVRSIERDEDYADFMAHIHEMKRVPAQEAVNDAKRILILGDPGSGKSTFVKHLAHILATSAGSNDPAGALAKLSPWTHGWVLPVRIELRNVAAYAARERRTGDALLLRAFLHDQLLEARQIEVWSWLGDALDDPERPVLLMLDGLDEVPRGQRLELVGMVHDWCRRHAHHRLVVTCRPYAYIGQPWRLHGFHEVTLAPFNSAQIDRFVANWYARLEKLDRLTHSEAEESRIQLQSALHQSDLHSLAERPLLLTVMAQLHSFTGQLPADRTQLYADAVNLLLLRWESRIATSDRTLLQQLDVPGLKLSDLEAGLFEVAYHAHADNPGRDGDTADVDEIELCRCLRRYLGGSYEKAEQFLLYIRERAGLLIRRKSESYTFPHRAFQEFLAACHLTGRPDYPREVAAHVREDYDRWREVFVLSAGHAARTQRLGQAIAAVNALCPLDPPSENERATDPADWLRADVAGQALLEIGLIGVQREPDGQAVYGRVRSWLAQAVRRSEVLVAKQRVAAGVTLAKLGDPRPAVTDPRHMEFCFVPPGPFRMGEGDEQYEHNLDSGYWIARFPVTNQQFKAFVDGGGYANSDYWREASEHSVWRDGQIRRYFVYVDEKGQTQVGNGWFSTPHDYGEPFNLPNHPVVGVTWYEALAYTRWLDELCQDHGWLPSGLHVALPNEPEWEKAGRGGLRLPAAATILALSAMEDNSDPVLAGANATPSRRYPWGNEADAERASYRDTEIGVTSAAGCFGAGASPYGVEELAGNAWEWTRSLYARLPYRGDDGQENLAAGVGEARSLRGGAYYNDVDGVGCGVRYRYGPLNEDDYLGFRVVLSPSTSGR